MKPDYFFDDIHAIDLIKFFQKGYRFILTDLDNTIADPYVLTPEAKLIEWVNEVKRLGFQILILTNGSNKEKLDNYERILQVPVIRKAKKPKRDNFSKALTRLDAKPEQTLMFGDRWIPDIIGARRSNITSVMVTPILRAHDDFSVKIVRIFEDLVFPHL